MEWMTVRVFSKSLGHFRPVALAITTQQFEFARFKNYQTEEGVQGTCMKSSWHAIGTKGTRRGSGCMGCLVYYSYVSALRTDTQNSESAFPAVYHDQHHSVEIMCSSSLEEQLCTQLQPIVLTIKNCPRICRGSAYRPRNSDRIPCKPKVI